MDKIVAKNLLKLASFLRTVPRESFNLDFVTARNEQEVFNNEKSLNICSLKNYKCGYTGCAVGWSPNAFPKELQWEVIYDEDQEGYSIGIRFTHPTARKYIENEIGNGANHIWSDAATELTIREFFDLTQDQFQYLFHPDYYKAGRKGPKSVATRIEQFVKSDGRLPKTMGGYG